MSGTSKKQKDELLALAAIPDDDIDTSDIPETLGWSGADVGRFYRPLKKPVTIRLDADVLAWFKSQGGNYQSVVNQALREYMLEHLHSKG